MRKPKVIAIVGPTASGKTSLSIEIAKRYAGEVISADSRQVYKGLDIGTGKVTTEEMQGIQHHLIDVAAPTETYTAADFDRDASKAISEIVNRHHLPIVAGGTFFYLDLLRGKSSTAPVEPNPELRSYLESKDTAKLLELLEQADKERAKTIDPNNRRRLIRALEIVEALGKVPKTQPKESPYDWLIIGVEVEKKQLLINYAKRIEQWLKTGCKEEVEQLLASGLTRERLRELGFEYSLMLSYIEKETTKTELEERFVQKNWQYAKRQLTWLKRDQEIIWCDPNDTDRIFKLAENFLHLV